MTDRGYTENRSISTMTRHKFQRDTPKRDDLERPKARENIPGCDPRDSNNAIMDALRL